MFGSLGEVLVTEGPEERRPGQEGPVEAAAVTPGPPLRKLSPSWTPPGSPSRIIIVFLPRAPLTPHSPQSAQTLKL